MIKLNPLYTLSPEQISWTIALSTSTVLPKPCSSPRIPPLHRLVRKYLSLATPVFCQGRSGVWQYVGCSVVLIWANDLCQSYISGLKEWYIGESYDGLAPLSAQVLPHRDWFAIDHVVSLRELVIVLE